LRHRRFAIRALDHFLLLLATEIDRNLTILNALGIEQVLGPPAETAKGLGVDFNTVHG
jgi:hypothetical protein